MNYKESTIPNSNSLMISVSGIRGIIPTGLNLQSLIQFTLAYAKVLNPKTIVIGRDSRPSGEFIENIVSGVLLSIGINVKIIGIVPTPTLKSIVNETKSDGGIMISASHNPLEWNAFKFVGKNGFFFDAAQINKLKEFIVEDNLPLPKFSPNSTKQDVSSEYTNLHFESVFKQIEVSKIKKKKFKVFVDAVNGGGSFIVPTFLEKLGCKVYRQYCTPDGTFPRPPEPTPSALAKTAKLMKKTDADIGFALDPDADRLIVLTSKRGVISEEYTLPLSVYSVLDSKSKNIVINLSTSFITKEIVAPYGKTVHLAKVGEANVVQEMIEKKAFFGGEGNGGVIDPTISSFGRDSLAGIGHILNFLSLNKTNIDKQLDLMPKLFMKKESIAIQGQNISKIFNKLKDIYKDSTMSEKDGIRFDFESSWIHVRASNTEPIIRIIAEAKNENDLQMLLKKTKEKIES